MLGQLAAQLLLGLVEHRDGLLLGADGIVETTGLGIGGRQGV